MKLRNKKQFRLWAWDSNDPERELEGIAYNRRGFHKMIKEARKRGYDRFDIEESTDDE